MANSAAALRLQSDLKAISQSPPEGCTSFPGPGQSHSGLFLAIVQLLYTPWSGLWCVNWRSRTVQVQR